MPTFRTLVRQPGSSFLIVAMVALGIAGTTAIFSIFNGLFLRPLPFSEPERLVDLDETAPRWNLEFTGIAYPDFDAWRRHNSTFDSMAVWNAGAFNLSGRGAAERVDGARVTHDLLNVLRLQPVLGRGILPEEDKPGGQRVVLLGYGLWQRMFGGRRDVLGETLHLDAQDHTVVGVLPPEAQFPGRADLWTPLAVDAADNRGWWLNGLGRLKSGVTIDQAREDLTRIHKGQIETRKVNEITSPKILPVRERYLGNFRIATRVLLGAVGVVLLIACINVAGLTLARATARSREIGIRAALGASRLRIAGQLLGESLVLAALGGLLGTALGYAALKGLLSMVPDLIPRWVRFDLDVRFLVFTILVTAASAVLFGLWPALDAARVDVHSALHESSVRSSASVSKRRGLSFLVVGEIGLAAVLLIGAGLLVQAFRHLQRLDPGFRPDGVLTYRVSLPGARYAKPPQRVAYFRELLDRTRALPGVRQAGVTTATPLGGHWGNFFRVENAPPLAPGEQDPVVLQRVVSSGYLETMGMTLLYGRFFTPHDEASPEAARVAIVNETFARRSWPNLADPTGKRIRHNFDTAPWLTVVGVIRDVKDYGLDGEVRPSVYLNYLHNTPNTLSVAVRTATEPDALVSASREILRRLDPDVPAFQVRTMQDRIQASLGVRRAYSWLLAVFAGVAVLLAVSGLYGVISYTVGRRTREIGIRMALGARQGQVLRDVLRQGMMLALVGVGLGVAGGYGVARLLGSLLFGVSAFDPWTYFAVAILLAGVSLLANLFPARRAAAVDPMAALRAE